ncbi:MAG TPA: TIGR02646 family protein [Lentisphaeria bacterium]|nr:TIGR02646 family protein [Lentisphaerota bacterium]OQC17656.1 MAG: hypothetical protein BWX73_00098 [Lentisphaerae bacterium ADurb.Bin082]HQC51780.1 TIGR02646 family protein [Lentisphaeria bacterium]
MHKLDRTSAQRPACLDNYRHSRDTWDALTPLDRQQIRASLQQMQNDRCAYCEGEVFHKGHIEHFRRRHCFPHLTFDWDNLFLSCGAQGHCGHYKDHRNALPYNPNDLIKPDVDDPDTFLYFHSSGEVRVRGGTSEAETHRAKETIRVFNLNYGRLTAERRATLKIYRQSNPGILEELAQWDDQLRQDYIAEEIAANRNTPYVTVIRHFFEKVS